MLGYGYPSGMLERSEFIS